MSRLVSTSNSKLVNSAKSTAIIVLLFSVASDNIFPLVYHMVVCIIQGFLKFLPGHRAFLAVFDNVSIVFRIS